MFFAVPPRFGKRGYNNDRSGRIPNSFFHLIFRVQIEAIMVQRLRELLTAKPFTPFTITMSDGSKHEVRHPEHAALAKHFLFVVDADNEETLHAK